MTDHIRTPESNFAGLDDFPFAPHAHAWKDLRVSYIDEGPRDALVMLLLHGMPTWSYLYRKVIPPLLAAGYRCIAPDHLGFGRSDKPSDPHWYTIARHVEVLTSLVVALDLRRVTLVVQDWGGPIGLAQAVTMPERFERLVIMNTWLHHPGFAYTQAIRNWNNHWRDGGLFHRPSPDIGLLLLLSSGLATREQVFPAIVNGTPPTLDGEAAHVYRGYSAPYRGLPDAVFAGYRRFPLSIPIDGDAAHLRESAEIREAYANGNAAAQTHHYRQLLAWSKPVYFVWGTRDDVFTEAWGREWAARMGAPFDAVPEAAHFLQESHGDDIARLLLARIAAER